MVTCLLVIQTLSATGFRATFFEPSGDPSIALAGSGASAICDDAAKHDDSAHHQHNPSQCCIYCAARFDAPSFLAAAILAKIIVTLAPEKGAPHIYPPQDRGVLRQLGWESSWSSTAPPRA